MYSDDVAGSLSVFVKQSRAVVVGALLVALGGCIDQGAVDENGGTSDDGLAAVEQDLSTTNYVWALPYKGGDGGSAKYTGCGANGVMVGIYARYANYIDRLGPICRTIQANGSLSPAWTAPDAGGSGGNWDVSYQCAYGKAVTGFTGGAATYLDRISATCSPLPNLPTVDPNVVGNFTSTAGQGYGGHGYQVQCPSGYAVTDMEIHAGSWVDGFRATCRYVQP